MFENRKTDAEWRKSLEEVEEQCSNKLTYMQKDLDKVKYELANKRREVVQIENLLTHTLGYFLNERNLPIPNKDLDLFYLKEIIDKYHQPSENSDESKDI